MRKTLLYISCNSKPEKMSSSKTVARLFIQKFIEKNPDFDVEEIDLFKDYIPRLEYEYFAGRSALVEEKALKQLDDYSQKEVKRINDLCDQFMKARVYVIAAPMWSSSFPPQLKEYFDCVIQDKKTIKFENKKPKGKLNDLDRSLVYIQSSGGKIPVYTKPMLNRGVSYIKYISKFMGIKKTKEILVDGTGNTEEERLASIDKASNEIEKVMKSLKY
ncbi:FMN-dependent NADH-azoreductase [Terrisporobacter mayombei]|uniref:FMN dependent NADH:quinone oxidoreductase n=1 Tax=Terrisporobacter mayombei TaxID=1541 RepID=A0ABY9PXL5_9FIRM|nr:NAD(P)H-dependent oxidoreductase [Terrisporobacter mayombei]MCC3868297.1 NAD(P)H-dependent oxidoreductase [Terrisporobacter mayombei]WMT80438.1 FMN-dependent NADH-azoreductase 2 [Terrisporobacter mayombei]